MVVIDDISVSERSKQHIQLWSINNHVLTIEVDDPILESIDELSYKWWDGRESSRWHLETHIRHIPTLLINRARYHLKRNAPMSKPTFVLNPDCNGSIPLSHNPAVFIVSIRSHACLPVNLSLCRSDGKIVPRSNCCGVASASSFGLTKVSRNNFDDERWMATSVVGECVNAFDAWHIATAT